VIELTPLMQRRWSGFGTSTTALYSHLWGQVSALISQHFLTAVSLGSFNPGDIYVISDSAKHIRDVFELFKIITNRACNNSFSERLGD
jgi:hypothetical protein